MGVTIKELQEVPWPNNLLAVVYYANGSWKQVPKPKDFDGSLEYVLHELSKPQRDIIQCILKNKLSLKETSEILGESEDNIKRYLNSGMSKLTNIPLAGILVKGIQQYYGGKIAGARDWGKALAMKMEKKYAEKSNALDIAYAQKLLDLSHKIDNPSQLGVARLNLPIRIHNILLRNNITTVGEVVMHYTQNLTSTEPLGKKQFGDLQKIFKDLGYDIPDRRLEDDPNKD